MQVEKLKFMAKTKKLLVVDIAALGWNLVSENPSRSANFDFKKASTLFPAVTCPIQASFRTARLPCDHGMIANGIFSANTRKISFWEQSASLVKGERIWQNARMRGKQVGMMFWQQSLGEQVDLLLSPKPVHKHHGGMIQDCYSQPHDLYEQFIKNIGQPFNLMHYWGPLASQKSSEWIVEAIIKTLQKSGEAPDVLFSYIPHMDYDLQRFGPGSKQAKKAFDTCCNLLQQLKNTAEKEGYDYLFFGDYNIEPANGTVVFPNRELRKAGWFNVRSIRGHAYPDFFTSSAFAMADHQIAHVFVANPDIRTEVQHMLETLDGVARVLDRSAQSEMGINHPRSGDLVLIANEGAWFAYPWWSDTKEAPDYAGHVDIHNKPGYDPCELFFGWPPPHVSQNPARIRGTHGRAGKGTEIAWTSSLDFRTSPASLLELAQEVQNVLI